MQQLRHYTRVIWHWLWLIVLGTGICAGATYAISSRLTPVYQATALIQVGTSDPSTVYNNQAEAISDALLITSTNVLQAVAQKMPGVTVDQLTASVSAAPKAGTQLIEVWAKANDPQLAANIVNTLVNSFIKIEEDKLTGTLQTRADQLAKTIDAMKVSVADAQARLNTLEATNATLDKITQQQNLLTTDKQSLDALTTQYQQVQWQQLQSSTLLNVVQTATPPSTPISPRVLLNTLIAAALGFVVLLALALLLDWMDMTIKTPDDVVHIARMEALGSVPLSKYSLLVNSSGIVLSDNDEIEKAFSLIGTSFSLFQKDQRTIMVTSLRAGSGSTTVATNLAVWLALAGKRVLLIDANLRQPALHTLFQRPNTYGLVNTLGDIDQFQEHDLVGWHTHLSTSIPNLWVLPSGPVPVHPASALRTPKLQLLQERLLQASRGRPFAVDLIIFDSAPLLAGVETVTLAPFTDGTILVVDAAKERAEVLQEAQGMLKKLRSPIIGVVVNRRRRKHRSYFYTQPSQFSMDLVTNIAEQVAPPAVAAATTTVGDTPEPSTTFSSFRGQPASATSSFANRSIGNIKIALPSVGLPQNTSGSGIYKDSGTDEF
ncbi:MAG TPA: AAA family ATPase [Ktedonosporobacter sp.]|nr:AAA family ATPase [Ktedonosporobacter sp.]